MNETAENVQAALSVKDAQELLALQAGLLQPAAEKAAAYSRHLYDIAASTNADLTKMVESQARKPRPSSCRRSTPPCATPGRYRERRRAGEERRCRREQRVPKACRRLPSKPPTSPSRAGPSPLPPRRRPLRPRPVARPDRSVAGAAEAAPAVNGKSGFEGNFPEKHPVRWASWACPATSPECVSSVSPEAGLRDTFRPGGTHRAVLCARCVVLHRSDPLRARPRRPKPWRGSPGSAARGRRRARPGSSAFAPRSRRWAPCPAAAGSRRRHCAARTG